MTFPKILFTIAFPLYVAVVYVIYYMEQYMKISKIKKDVAASEAGVWINGVTDDLDVKIASASNRKATEYMRQLIKPYERTIKNKTNEWFVENIQNPVYARYVLVGWRNLQDENGVEIPYSEDKALELLQDPENEDFRKIIVSLADEAELFRKEALEELAKK